MNKKVAIITGATSGIGKACVDRFASEYYITAIGRNTSALDELVSKYSSLTKIHTVKTDLSEVENISRIINETINVFGQIDLIINAAGIISSGTIENTSYSDYQYMMRVNVDAPFILLQKAIPYLKKTQGNVINVSSVAGKRSFPGILSYSVSKAAMDQLTRVSALDLAEYGIRVNAVNPGVVITDLHKRGGMSDDKYREFLEHSKTTHPLGRVGKPEEIAELIYFLTKSEWITGETVSIDGGRFLTCLR